MHRGTVIKTQVLACVCMKLDCTGVINVAGADYWTKDMYESDINDHFMYECITTLVIADSATVVV